MAVTPQAQTFMNEFVKNYFGTFDTNNQGLGFYYRDNSILTHQGERFEGAAAILGKLTNLGFKKVRHESTDPAVQLTQNGSVILLTSGLIFTDDDPRPLPFSQVFLVAQDASNNWFILNDVFQLGVAF